jgi:hypothetical protein
VSLRRLQLKINSERAAAVVADARTIVEDVERLAAELREPLSKILGARIALFAQSNDAIQRGDAESATIWAKAAETIAALEAPVIEPDAAAANLAAAQWRAKIL